MSQLDALLHETLAGNPEAWQQLQAALEPMILAFARRSRGLRHKGLAASPDDLREIVVAALERFARNNFQNLRRFAETGGGAGEPSSGFDSWVYGAVEFVIREHLRQRYGRAPVVPASEALQVQPSKRDLQSYAGRLDDGDGAGDRALMNTLRMTTKLTAAQIVEHIAREFSQDETRAIGMYYIEDRDFAEIASALGLEAAKDAERLIRRLNARLRHHFSVKDADVSGGS
jgi:DNA-directed RNA polymerase specialized sigma24 family protein